MKTHKKISGKRWTLYFVLAVLAGLIVFLFIPANYYVHRALMFQMPKIDHYRIFENREVIAGDPQPWNFAANYDTQDIPPRHQAYFEELGTVAFLVIRDGEVIFEQYWDDHSEESYVNSFSMAKSVLSLLVGCAIDDGFIKSVEQPVSDFLPEWTSFNGKVLTIKHLLTMSAGVKWDESYSSLFSPTTNAYYGNDLWKLTRAQVLEEEPGVRFNYQSGVSQILAFLLQKAVGKPVSEYASERLWTPIGAEQDALWSLDRKGGMEKAYCCFNSNARDFARLGQLVLNKGAWGTKQVIDTSYINAMLTPSTWLSYTPKPTPDGQPYLERPCTFYGYQIWLAQHQGMTIPYLRGILGQYIFVIPEMNAVIVRLGHKRDKVYNIDQNYTVDVDVWLDAGIEILNRKF